MNDPDRDVELDLPAPVGYDGALTVPTADDGALIPADPFEGRRKIACFLDLSTPERVAQLGRAISLDPTEWIKHAGKCVDLIGLTAFTRQISPSGEIPVRYGPYLALHLADGTNIITASEGLIDDLPLLARAYGRPPWPAGVAVTLGRIRTSAGRYRHCLIPGKVVQPKECQ